MHIFDWMVEQPNYFGSSCFVRAQLDLFISRAFVETRCESLKAGKILGFFSFPLLSRKLPDRYQQVEGAGGGVGGC